MQDDLISRKDALASIKNLYPDMPVVDIFRARRKWLEKYAPYFECENAIEHLPSVKPQEKTGHWIYKTMKGQFCSICDGQSVWKFNYCPNCGAKLVEKQESEE